MLRTLLGCLAGMTLAAGATAQSAGTTYPEGSNLPQRTAGQLAPNTVGTIGGSAGANTSRTARSAKARAAKYHAKARETRSRPGKAAGAKPR